MISEERVWTILAQANPIPELDVLDEDAESIATYLAELEERSSEMTKVDVTRKPESRRTAMTWLAAASVVVLIGVVFVLTKQNSEEVPPATTSPEVAAVLTAIDTFNSGDGEAFRALFEPSSEEVSEPWSWEGNQYHTHDVMMAANEQLSVIGECEASSSVPIVVDCLISESNDWHGKAGITHDVETEFQLNDELLISSWTFDYGCCADEFAFNSAFASWMSEAHAEVFFDIRAMERSSFPGYQRDPAHMAAAVEYVDEFLAQSEDYPVDLHKQVVGGIGD